MKYKYVYFYLTANFLDWLISQFSLDKALMFGGQLLEGVDEARVEELRSSKVFEQWNDIFLLSESPHSGDYSDKSAVTIQPRLLAHAKFHKTVKPAAREDPLHYQGLPCQPGDPNGRLLLDSLCGGHGGKVPLALGAGGKKVEEHLDKVLGQQLLTSICPGSHVC